ncbi:hypothetical protein CWE07_13780 [Aliidiomarina maris]|uniref:Uncharacterized protein n=1 Tax=Aliidiomarina maris TaxID=531312 RepID=A0A327WN58_9GAMM|nr:hypothetical protein B0I24_12036 [Aliidiomarina maris]RUO18563.1 hypothetical protein CWE07_13780 [Aliidiomarina maris]
MNDVTARLMELNKKQRQRVLAAAKKDACNNEGKLRFYTKWYAVQVVFLIVVSFSGGYGIGVASRSLGSEGPTTSGIAVMVAVTMILIVPIMHDRLLAWFIHPYLAKHL